MPKRFSNQRGVTRDVSSTTARTEQRAVLRAACTRRSRRAGYTADKNIRVAGYDARLTPDLGGFLARRGADRADLPRQRRPPVQLVGHSNGPLYAQYLLTHTTRAWRHKYIHGFTPIAGNFPGQGSVYSIMFTGLNIEDFSYPTTHANAVTARGCTSARRPAT